LCRLETAAIFAGF
jgi:hypothetical protein